MISAQRKTQTDVKFQALGDRLRSPGFEASGDRSHKVPQSDVPGQEKPSRASGDPIVVPRIHQEHSSHGTRSVRLVWFLLNGKKEQNTSAPSGCKESSDPHAQASRDRLQFEEDNDAEKVLSPGAELDPNSVENIEEHIKKVRTNESDKFPTQQ